ncbi:Kinase-like protein [Mycena sanguinolenta]|uniref:Kinase-like protein n=1 Tax=Mycena sanguinolenta TaxID=230812 RepID=A0A8H6YI23_9AGAR|nr:Kinase-like protein [Mycena sanguinolenta]
MFAAATSAATSFFARTAISQSYNIGSPSGAAGSRSSTPGPSGSSSAPVAFSPPLNVGLWRVQSASHKTTNKRVSVWSFDKRSPEMERLRPAAKERTLEILKAEIFVIGVCSDASPAPVYPRLVLVDTILRPFSYSARKKWWNRLKRRGQSLFSRRRHAVLSSLELSIPSAVRHKPLVELDEVEIQKGILQICKGLSFLHSSAQLIHSNIGPESIIINSAGDWKIAGLGLTIPLMTPGGGGATRWEFPTFDGHVPAYVQRSFDYMAPEYALDEQLVTASDMYSLGCLIYAVHCQGNPPFKNHGSLGGLRENAGKPPPHMESLDSDLQGLLRSLITRHAANRPTPTTLPTHGFFSSLPISTLNFLDRSNFTAKTREEKISFMKGLVNVLDKFSEGLRSRKILPSLLEEMKDTHLLPYILPNVFAISTVLSSAQFASMVLPSLKPLFVVKEPPQNMLTLLDNLAMLQSKTDKVVFREQVLPLVYNALESEHAVVQERALQCVPDLCESIDYAEVQGVLFPRVAIVFTKTRVLTVKVATLTTFLAMVKTLDQTSLTQKLVPLLSKIRTKEPAVTMATLVVQEAMGLKVDREAVATLVLPQLWAMSMGPLLSLDQFQRFMGVIRKLGDRVEEEHKQFLRDSQRLEDRSATAVNGATGIAPAGGVDFASLVGRANGATVKADTPIDANVSWDDDPWASILNDNASPGSNTPCYSGDTFLARFPTTIEFPAPTIAAGIDRYLLLFIVPFTAGATLSANATSILHADSRITTHNVWVLPDVHTTSCAVQTKLQHFAVDHANVWILSAYTAGHTATQAKLQHFPPNKSTGAKLRESNTTNKFLAFSACHGGSPRSIQASPAVLVSEKAEPKRLGGFRSLGIDFFCFFPRIDDTRKFPDTRRMNNGVMSYVHLVLDWNAVWIDRNIKYSAQNK